MCYIAEHRIEATPSTNKISGISKGPVNESFAPVLTSTVFVAASGEMYLGGQAELWCSYFSCDMRSMGTATATKRDVEVGHGRGAQSLRAPSSSRRQRRDVVRYMYVQEESSSSFLHLHHSPAACAADTRHACSSLYSLYARPDAHRGNRAERHTPVSIRRSSYTIHADERAQMASIVVAQRPSKRSTSRSGASGSPA